MFIYDKDTLKFDNNGLGYINDVIRADITLTLNGEYSLSAEFPTFLQMSSYLQEENILKVKFQNSYQLFRIKKIEKKLNTISVYALHIFYDLADNFLIDVFPKNLNCEEFGTWLLSKSDYQHQFVFTSNIPERKSGRYVRRNIVEAIIGDIDNSMVNLFGGELKRDNFNVHFNQKVGSDNGVKLILGKNIKGIKINIDSSTVVTRMIPIGYDGLLLDEIFVDSIKINNYSNPKITKLEFSDVKYDPDSTEEGVFKNKVDAQNELRRRALEVYQKNHIDEPNVNITIDWIELSKTDQYKEFSNLEELNLGDTIHANLMGLNYSTRIIKIKYNVLTEMIDKFEIGNVKASFVDTVRQVKEQIEKISPSAILEDAKKTASDLIKSANGGVVVKRNGELFIVDNPDLSKAKNVWRWNINGLGYSSTGIDGTYGLAMTMDGKINADYILTGKVKTNVIEGWNDLNDTVSKINLDFGKIQNQVINNINLTKEITSDGTYLVNKAISRDPLIFKILGSEEVYNNIYPSEVTFPSNDLILGGLKDDLYN